MATERAYPFSRPIRSKVTIATKYKAMRFLSSTYDRFKQVSSIFDTRTVPIQRVSFLALPPGVRNRVYHFALLQLSTPASATFLNAESLSTKCVGSLALLFSCKTVLREFLPMFARTLPRMALMVSLWDVDAVLQKILAGYGMYSQIPEIHFDCGLLSSLPVGVVVLVLWSMLGNRHAPLRAACDAGRRVVFRYSDVSCECGKKVFVWIC